MDQDQTNYVTAKELIERHKGTDSWDTSTIEAQLAAMIASALLSIVDAIKEGGRDGQGTETG